MNWNGRRVLVTGAGGFIGSHLTERLVELGATTRAFVHYRAVGAPGWLGSSPLRDHIEVIAGDITDRDSLNPAVQGVDAVFHLAALIAIPYSYHAPASYVRTNVEGTLNVLQVARDAGVGLVVHTSTSEVYGTARYVPIDEAHPLHGQSPYAATKIGADMLVQAFHLSFALPVVTVRPFNTFGPRQSARAVIPTIITQCLKGGCVRLGNVYPTRDLNYVANTIEGFLLAASIPGAIGRTINIGSGEEISIGTLADLIARILGTTIEMGSDGERIRPQASEVDRLCSGNQLAHTLLGWSPHIGLEEGLKHTIEWLRQHCDSYQPETYTV